MRRPDAAPVPVRPVPVRPAPVRPALRGVYLTVYCDGMVCLVGQSAVGKAAILSKLVSRYEPGRVTLVPRDPWLVPGTIAGNIAAGRPAGSAAAGGPGATRSAIVEAARTALLHPFVETLPDGYDTVLSEAAAEPGAEPGAQPAARLTAGQRWQLALARALLGDPDVLVLDEPTSGLDADGELRVMAAIERAAGGRLALVVSHRLRVSTRADRVLVMSGGQCAGAGIPAELVALGRTFAGWSEGAAGAVAGCSEGAAGAVAGWSEGAAGADRVARSAAAGSRAAVSAAASVQDRSAARQLVGAR